MHEELTREQLMGLKMSVLRAMYPEIKDNKKSDFVDKIFLLKKEVSNQKEVIKTISDPEGLDIDSAVEEILASKGSEKILLIASGSEAKDKRFDSLVNVLRDVLELDNKSFMSNSGSCEMHLNGVTFVKVTCPVRYPVAVKNRRYDIELKLV